jgi:hypothetical protein
LVERGVLVRRGAGRGTHYLRPPGPLPVYRRTFKRGALAEDQVLNAVEAAVPELARLPKADSDAFAYALTEMVNNAIDHSASPSFDVALWLAPKRVAFEVEDRGIGAFERFRRAFHLPDALAALQQLSKGKATSAAARHSGEGIFFTSKVATWFELEANGLRWVLDNRRHDTAIAPASRPKGTRVRVELDHGATRSLSELFEEYTHDFAFDVTRTLVKLFEYGERFVSRSEAKRLAQGLERFREVILDFAGVRMVGQGFVDELFRVWQGEHPTVELRPVNMNPAVALMVRRGAAAR